MKAGTGVAPSGARMMKDWVYGSKVLLAEKAEVRMEEDIAPVGRPSRVQFLRKEQSSAQQERKKQQPEGDRR